MRTTNRLTIWPAALALALFTGLVSVIVAEDNPVGTPAKQELRYQMTPGTQFDFAIDRDREIGERAPDGEAVIRVSERVLFGARVDSVGPDGLALSFEYQERTHHVEREDFSGSTDFSELIGRPVQVMLSPTGKLSSFRGFLALPEMPIVGERRILRRQEYVNDFATNFPELPAMPVGVGDTWSYETHFYERVVAGQIKITLNMTYTVMADTVRDGLRCLRCVGDFTLQARGQGIDEGSGIQLDVDLTGGGTETMYFAYEKGMVLESDARTTIEGTAFNTLIRFAAPLRYEIRTRVKTGFK